MAYFDWSASDVSLLIIYDQTLNLPVKVHIYFLFLYLTIYYESFGYDRTLTFDANTGLDQIT